MSADDPQRRRRWRDVRHRLLAAASPPRHVLRRRDNFPPFEAALAAPTGGTVSKGGGGDDEEDDDDDDNGSASASPRLDLSIGTRAALAAHQRRVARFGLDGERDGAPRASGGFYIDDEFDDPWERLLRDDGGSEPSAATDWSSLLTGSGASLDRRRRRRAAGSVSSSDHFSFGSSVASRLLTPERHRHGDRATAVTVRGAPDAGSDGDEADDPVSPAASSRFSLGTVEFPPHLTPVLHLDPLSPMAALDLSLISHDGSGTVSGTGSPPTGLAGTPSSDASRPDTPHRPIRGRRRPPDGDSVPFDEPSQGRGAAIRLGALSLSPIPAARQAPDGSAQHQSGEGHRDSSSPWRRVRLAPLTVTPSPDSDRFSVPLTPVPGKHSHPESASPSPYPPPFTWPLSAQDRRRFRSVVPRRVFLGEAVPDDAERGGSSVSRTATRPYRRSHF